MKKISAGLTALTLLLVFMSGSCSAKAQEITSADLARAFNDAGTPLLRQTISARDFTLPLVSGAGETLRLSDLRGKVVFLNFWATWCPPCRDEMPSMESLYRRFSDRGLEILAVNLRESEQEVAGFMRRYDLSFPAVLDLDGRIGTTYGVQAIPTTFLVDREGNIILRKIGSLDWDSPDIRRAMEQLLNQ